MEKRPAVSAVSVTLFSPNRVFCTVSVSERGEGVLDEAVTSVPDQQVVSKDE